jgi:hypothetical protein
MPPTALDIRQLLLRSLQDLDPYREDEWDQKIHGLNEALLGLESSVEETLSTVVAVSAAIQQLLLEAAARPSAGRPRQLIIDTVAWLLLDETSDAVLEEAEISAF